MSFRIAVVAVFALLTLGSCEPQAPREIGEDVEDLTPGTRVHRGFTTPPGVRFITEEEAESCERIAEVSEEDEIRQERALNRVLHMADALNADAVLVESLVYDTRGINSYVATGVAYRCR